MHVLVLFMPDATPTAERREQMLGLLAKKTLALPSPCSSRRWRPKPRRRWRTSQPCFCQARRSVRQSIALRQAGAGPPGRRSGRCESQGPGPGALGGAAQAAAGARRLRRCRLGPRYRRGRREGRELGRSLSMNASTTYPGRRRLPGRPAHRRSATSSPPWRPGQTPCWPAPALATGLRPAAPGPAPGPNGHDAEAARREQL